MLLGLVGEIATLCGFSLLDQPDAGVQCAPESSDTATPVSVFQRLELTFARRAGDVTHSAICVVSPNVGPLPP